MGRYDNLKNPFQNRMVEWALRKTNNATEQIAKSIPMYVQQIEKDFVHASFVPQNGIFTMPIMKMPQSFSGYGREPTQTQDQGNAVPSNYYMGGVSGFSGGNTSFYPRGNLSSLSYQPSSNMNASGRDYDQHTETGGPNGWLVKVMDQSGMQNQGGGGNGGGGGGSGSIAGASLSAARANQRAIQRRSFIPASRLKISTADSSGGGGGGGGGGGNGGSGGQGGQQQDQTQYQYDKNGKLTMQSKNTQYNFTMDSQNKVATMNVPTGAWAYVGGDGKNGSYAQLVTTKGPVVNAKGRYS